MATDAMDIDMDMDPELARFQAEAAQLSALPDDLTRENDEAMNVVEEGEVAGDEIAGNKVHLIGLDELGEQDVRNFANDAFRKSSCKVEWVNDSSANLVYDSNEIAAEALKAFSVESSDDLLEERRAVELTTHPHIALYVRMARNTDVKDPKSYLASRYYLYHPEVDPSNRPQRGRGLRRGGPRRGGYEGRRRVSQEDSTFDVGLYDDDPGAKAASAKRRLSPRSDDDLFAGRNKSRRLGNRGDSDSGDLIADRRGGRLRNRSASPVREGDGRFGFSDDQPYRQTARRRSPPPLRSRSKQENGAASKRIQQDLFAKKKTGTPLTNGHVDTKKTADLIPKFAATSIDLFPDKVNHRRQDAQDLGPDEVTFAIGRRPDNASKRNGGAMPRDLFARIKTSAGRLSERQTIDDNDAGFSIRGAGESQGFSIKGASRDDTPRTELFPNKNLAPDLFAHKMTGRGAQRKTAGDLF